MSAKHDTSKTRGRQSATGGARVADATHSLPCTDGIE
jgi:hypothetical protein